MTTKPTTAYPDVDASYRPDTLLKVLLVTPFAADPRSLLRRIESLLRIASRNDGERRVDVLRRPATDITDSDLCDLIDAYADTAAAAVRLLVHLGEETVA